MQVRCEDLQLSVLLQQTRGSNVTLWQRVIERQQALCAQQAATSNLTELNSTDFNSLDFANPDDVTRGLLGIDGFMVYAYVTPFIFLIGLLGNLISIRVFASRKIRQLSTSLYFSAISTCDCIVLSTYVLFNWLRWGLRLWPGGRSVAFINTPGVCEAFLFLSYSCRFVSVWLIVLFTAERYVAVCLPLYRKVICTPKVTRRAVVGVVVLAVLISLYKPITAGVYTLNSTTESVLEDTAGEDFRIKEWNYLNNADAKTDSDQIGSESTKFTSNSRDTPFRSQLRDSELSATEETENTDIEAFETLFEPDSMYSYLTLSNSLRFGGAAVISEYGNKERRSRRFSHLIKSGSDEFNQILNNAHERAQTKDLVSVNKSLLASIRGTFPASSATDLPETKIISRHSRRQQAMTSRRPADQTSWQPTLSAKSDQSKSAHNRMTSPGSVGKTSADFVKATKSSVAAPSYRGVCVNNPEYDHATWYFALELIYVLLITAIPFCPICILNLIILVTLLGKRSRMEKPSGTSRARPSSTSSSGRSREGCSEEGGKSNRSAVKREITVMLLTVSASFVLLNVPYCVLWMQTFLQSRYFPDYLQLLEHADRRSRLFIARTIFCANYSINFFLYCLTGSYFRSILVSLVSRRSLRQSSAHGVCSGGHELNEKVGRRSGLDEH